MNLDPLVVLPDMMCDARLFALCGHGFGGTVALEILRRAPTRVSRLCLIATNPMGETPARAAEREPQIIAARTGRLEQVIREELIPELLAETPFKAHIFDMMVDMALSLGPDVFVRQSPALQKRRDYQRSLALIKCPCLVLCGAEDRITPLQRQEFIAELIEHAELVLIENAGHIPTLEQPDATISALRHWLT